MCTFHILRNGVRGGGGGGGGEMGGWALCHRFKCPVLAVAVW